MNERNVNLPEEIHELTIGIRAKRIDLRDAETAAAEARRNESMIRDSLNDMLRALRAKTVELAYEGGRDCRRTWDEAVTEQEKSNRPRSGGLKT